MGKNNQVKNMYEELPLGLQYNFISAGPRFAYFAADASLKLYRSPGRRWVRQ